MVATPVPLGTPGEHSGGLHLADQPRDVPAERIGRLDAAVWVAKKPHVRYAEHSGRGLLLGLANPWDGRSGDLGIEPTGVPIAQHAEVTAVPASVQEATVPPAQKSTSSG
jgi:hypothetical protein